jgi:hypothetical protein
MNILRGTTTQVADSQRREFVTLLGAFEALTSPPNESQQFADLFARFQEAAQASQFSGADELSREARGLLDCFQSIWEPYLEANAEAPPSINIWRVTGLGLDEVGNCRVLKWLLDPNESHCRGTRLLRCLFEMMGEPWVDEGDTVLVRREVRTSEGDCRLDIVIESPLLYVCIEAKIEAQESREQLAEYFNVSAGRIRDRRFIGRLLTAGGKSGEPVSECFTRLLWSDVAQALRRFGCGENDSDPLAARCALIRELASQYADFITSHFGKQGNRR